jgi:hypothetical protein
VGRASGLFAKKAASYKLTGLERLVAGPATPLGRIYEFAIRLLELGAVPVPWRRPSEQARWRAGALTMLAGGPRATDQRAERCADDPAGCGARGRGTAVLA